MDRRDVETRILFAAEAQVAAQPGAPAYVLWGDDWHPGVIGIVAARIAERHFRPTVLIAMDGDTGTGSGRSIPAFDLLAGLHAGAGHLLRHGGHRAAAGLTIERGELEAFRAAFAAHAAAVLAPEDLVPSERIDAIVPGDALGLPLAEELARLEPFGAGNPAVSLLVPAATLENPRPMGEGRHVALHARQRRLALARRALRIGERAAAGPRRRRRPPRGQRLQRHRRAAARPAPRPAVVRRRSTSSGSRRPSPRACSPSSTRGWIRGRRRPAATATLRDVRDSGLAGTIADLVATGEPVLVVCAHAAHRAGALRDRVGGFALTTLERPRRTTRTSRARSRTSSPWTRRPHGGLEHLPGAGWAHLAWGEPELRFAAAIHEWEYTLREPLATVYRALRAAGGSRGEACEAVLRGEGTQPRTAAMAGRLVRVLTELGLASLDRAGLGLSLAEAPARTALERSAAFVAYRSRLESGTTFLTTSIEARAA